jgi:hypothetical protein
MQALPPSQSAVSLHSSAAQSRKIVPNPWTQNVVPLLFGAV